MHSSNIASHLPRLARQQPDTLAIVIPHRKLQFTYKQLDDASDITALGLQAIGITKGMRVVLMVTPGFEFFVLVFALFKIGAVMVAVDPGIGIKNLKVCLGEAEPEAFIGITKAQCARLLFGWAKKTIKRTVVVGVGSNPLVRLGMASSSLQQVQQRGRQVEKQILPETAAEDVAAILFTSGSTGVPKGVVYTHANFTAQVTALKKLFGIQPGEVDLATFPLFGLFAPAMGMTSVVPDMDFTRPAHVDPQTIFDAVESCNVTTMFGSPALLNRVGRWGVKHHKKLPGVRRVLSAGAPVSTQILECFSQLLDDNVQIYTPYGATESLPVSSIGSLEVLRETHLATTKGKGICVGRPVDELEVKIIGISDSPIKHWGAELEIPTGQIGEIIVKGPQVTAQYFNRQNSTDLAKIKDGIGGFYHRMGDAGYFDKQGRLWFCGRVCHRVMTEDEVLFSVNCEGVFDVHPKVFRTALVGVLMEGQTQPVLCVETEAGLSEIDQQQITDDVLEMAKAFEHTRSIQTVLFHSGFPVDIRHNAKIGREKLALWAQKKLL